MNQRQIAIKTIQIPSWLPLGVIVLLATILRLYQLGTESLWIDEMLSIWDAERLNDILTLPYVRPFYFLLLAGWMQLGTSDVWLRGLSVILGIASVFLTYQLGRRLVGEATGQIAALIMALSPLFINHSQEIRMYTLVSFLSLAGTLAMSYALQRPTFPTLATWSIARTALLVTNVNTVLIVLPDLLIVCWKYRQKFQTLFAWAAGFTVTGLFFLPPFWALTFGGVSQDFMSSQVGDYSKPGILQVVGMITQFVVYWPLRYLLKSNQIFLGKGELGDGSLINSLFATQGITLLFYAGFTALLCGLLGLTVIAVFTKHSSEQLLWLIAWAFIPAIATFVLSYLKGSIWFPRYLMFIAPYFLILVAGGFMVIWNWRKPVAIAVVAAYLIAVSGGLKDYYTTLYRNDWQGVAEFIQQNQQPEDVIVYYSVERFFDQSLPRYYQGDAPLYPINKPSADPLSPAYIQQELGSISPIESRLWLVCWVFCKDQDGIENVFETLAGDNFTLEEQKTFKSLEFDPVKVFLVRSDTDTPSVEPLRGS
ncbi:MAG: glycosyltransferase family 39 protein [Microcoleaceae cyanobacterium]